MNRLSFYNTYHQKNGAYSGVISENNFTYFYILRFLQTAFTLHFGTNYKAQLKKTRVLDIGCGVGTLALYLSKQVHWVTGLDVSTRAVDIAQQAKRNTHIKNATFRTMPLSKEKDIFDILICTEVIEHTPNDSEFLKQLYKRLKRGGMLLITTPSSENRMFERGWYAQFDREVGHERRYTQGSLRRLLKKHGFKVVYMREVEGVLRNTLFTTKLGFLIRGIKGPLIPIFHWLDMISVKLFGATDIQVYAVKDR